MRKELEKLPRAHELFCTDPGKDCFVPGASGEERQIIMSRLETTSKTLFTLETFCKLIKWLDHLSLHTLRDGLLITS